MLTDVSAAERALQQLLQHTQRYDTALNSLNQTASAQQQAMRGSVSIVNNNQRATGLLESEVRRLESGMAHLSTTIAVLNQSLQRNIANTSQNDPKLS